MKIPHFEAIFRGSSHKSHTLALERAETFVNTLLLKLNFAGTMNRLILKVFHCLFSNWHCVK